MPPDDRSNRHHENDHDFDRNPFVAFRRFADKKISSIFNGLGDPFEHMSKFDESFEEAQKEMWKRFEASYERATNPERRQIDTRGPQNPVHSSVSPDLKESHPPDENSPRTNDYRPSPMESFLGVFGKTSAAQEQERARRHAERRRPATSVVNDKGDTEGGHDPVEGLGFCPFWPSEQENDANGMPHWPFTMADKVEDRVSEILAEIDKDMVERETERARREMASRHSSSDDRILSFQSSYSPLHLEHEGPLRRQVDWRAAFEDLLCAERGEPMVGEYYNGYLLPQPRGSWLMNMLLRGHISMSNRWHQELFGFEPPCSFGETPESLAAKLDTELDVYDLFPHSFGQGAFVDDEETTPHAPTSQQRPQGTTAFQLPIEAPEKLQILSTLTSTEHVRLADGSTTTRRVLKRRFSDGREESEESTENIPASQQPKSLWENPSAVLRRLAPSDAESESNAIQNGNADHERKKNWFWSR